MPEKDPIVGLIYPPEGASLTPGHLHTLIASAYDAEDGSLSGASLTWTSDRDGALGQGSHLHTALSAGTHNLTLTATDSDGRVATAQVTVAVEYRLYLPVIMR